MLSPLTPNHITIDPVSHFFDTSMEIAVLRLDKLHPIISGNKWFKLRYYLEEAKAQNKKTIVTYGGAWSNHIIATAAACKMNGLNSVGIIRGEEPAELSPTLSQAKEWGMRLIFIPRTGYRGKYMPEEFTSKEYYTIDEGGYGKQGAAGAATIFEHIPAQFTHYCCAAGTGTMSAGLANAIETDQKVISVSVMKNNHSLEKMIGSLLIPTKKMPEVVHDYHFDGYAKYQPPLLQFMNDFYQGTHIPSDFVYTGKLFYAIGDLLKKGFFPPDSKILLIHSGGLQGNLSLRKGTLMF
ncbi:MAG: pyridoxal-phosphate dependent enzyme [Chitinophagaceae bacterium]